MMDTDIVRSHGISNSFYFVYSSGKAALFPFLPLFMRLIGLSATQTGIVIGLLAICTAIYAPIWLFCARKYEKRHGILMLSIFSCMATFLVMSLIPPKDKFYNPLFCVQNSQNEQIETHTQDFSMVQTSVGASTANGTHTQDFSMVQTSVASPSIENQLETVTTLLPAHSMTSTTPSPVLLWDKLPKSARKILKASGFSKSQVNEISAEDLKKFNITIPGLTGQEDEPHEMILETTTVSYVEPTTWNLMEELSEDRIRELMLLGYRKKDLKEMTRDDIAGVLEMLDGTENIPPFSNMNLNSVWYSLEPEVQDKLFRLGLWDEMQDLTKDEILEKLHNMGEDVVTKTPIKIRHSEEYHHGGAVTEAINHLQEMIEDLASLTFVYVILVIVIGMAFAAPLEKLVDMMWFEFLEALDLVERYDTNKLWQALGYLLSPLAVALGVFYCPCLLPMGVHRFSIHFYMFALCLGVTLVLGFLLPAIQDVRRPPRSTRVCKGLRILCADFPAFSYTFTICLLGIIWSCISNFLFWKIQDTGGSEVIMGAVISTGAFSELVIYLIMRSFIVKISIPGAVLLGFLALASQLLAYSFIWLSWAFIPVSLLQCFSHALIWGAVERYPDFKVTSGLADRSALSVLQSLYLGFGFSTGSIVSGILYDTIGIDLMYRSLVGLCLLWCVLFGIISKCCKQKEKILYSRLLADDNISEESDNEGSESDDWLENAMKNHK